VAVSILLVLTNNSVAKENSTIKFFFAPPASTGFIQKLTVVKEKYLGEDIFQLDESVLSTKISITKTQSGWDALAESKVLSIKRNGEVIDNPIASLLASTVIAYKLDANGKILNIGGYEALIEAVSKQLPPEVYKQLTPILNIEAMKAKDIAEWNGRISEFVGAEVKVGDSFVANTPYQLPNGSAISYVVRTRIAAIVPCGKKKCVRIEQTYDTQADNLAKLSGEVVSNISQTITPELQKSNADNNTATIQGTITRVIDPKTMLIYEESANRTIVMRMDISGKGLVPVKTKESRKYEFIY